jgi:hypothetical protein
MARLGSHATDEYLRAASDAVSNVIAHCSEESLEDNVVLARACLCRAIELIDAPQLPEKGFWALLSSLLVVIAAAIKRCGRFAASPAAPPELQDLIQRAKAVGAHVLNHPQTLDFVEEEAIRLISIIAVEVPGALREDCSTVVCHLLRGLTGPSDEMAALSALLIGDLFVRYPMDMVERAEDFMSVLFQRLSNPTLRFLPAAVLFYTVGDIIMSLDPLAAVVYRDATTGVMRAFARMDVAGDSVLNLKVIMATMHVARAMITVYGKLHDPESVKYLRTTRHLLFDPVKKLARIAIDAPTAILDEFIELVHTSMEPNVRNAFSVQIGWGEVKALITVAANNARDQGDMAREGRAVWLGRVRVDFLHGGPLSRSGLTE